MSNDIGDIEKAIYFLEVSVGKFNGEYQSFVVGTTDSYVARRNYLLGSLYLKINRKKDAIEAFNESVSKNYRDEPEAKRAEEYLREFREH